MTPLMDKGYNSGGGDENARGGRGQQGSPSVAAVPLKTLQRPFLRLQESVGDLPPWFPPQGGALPLTSRTCESKSDLTLLTARARFPASAPHLLAARARFPASPRSNLRCSTSDSGLSPGTAAERDRSRLRAAMMNLANETNRVPLSPRLVRGSKGSGAWPPV